MGRALIPGAASDIRIPVVGMTFKSTRSCFNFVTRESIFSKQYLTALFYCDAGHLNVFAWNVCPSTLCFWEVCDWEVC